MENLNFINPLLHGIIPEELEKKSIKPFCQTFGLRRSRNINCRSCAETGHQKAGAMVAGLALPILATAIYKKIQRKADEKKANANAANFDADNVNEHA